MNRTTILTSASALLILGTASHFLGALDPLYKFGAEWNEAVVVERLGHNKSIQKKRLRELDDRYLLAVKASNYCARTTITKTSQEMLLYTGSDDFLYTRASKLSLSEARALNGVFNGCYAQKYDALESKFLDSKKTSFSHIQIKPSVHVTFSNDNKGRLSLKPIVN